MNLAELFIRVNADISGIQKNMTAVQRSLDKTADRASALGQKLTLGISVPLTTLGGLSLKAAADFDSLRRGLEAVAGSAGAAEQQLARLREIAKLPAVDLNQAAQASLGFQSIGKSAEFAERMIKGVANAVALSGGGAEAFAGVMRQMRQVAGLGKLMGDELNIMLEAAPALGRALQAAFGTTSAEAIRNLNLTTEEFFERLQQGMESLPRVAGGARNTFDNLRLSLNQAAVVIGGQLLPAVIPLVDSFSAALEGIQKLDPEMVRLGIAFGVTAAALGPLITALSAATKAIVAFKVAGVAAAATVTVGGALVVGLAALAGMWTKKRLDEWSQAAEVTNKYRDSIANLSEAAASLELGDLSARSAEIREEMEGLAQTITVTEFGLDGTLHTLKRTNPEYTRLREELDGVTERMRDVTERLREIRTPAQAVADTIGDITTAAEAAAKALEKLDARIGFRGFDHTLGDPRIISESNLGGGRGPGGVDLNPRALNSRVLGSSSAPDGSGPGLAGQFFGALKTQAQELAANFGPLAAAAATLRPVFQGMMETLGPVLSTLAEPLRIVGQLLGSVIAPILKLLEPPLRALALVTSYVIEGLGMLIKAVGDAINALVPFANPANGVVRMGKEMIESAKAARKNLNAVNAVTEGMEKLASSMTNVPVVFADALRRFQASTGSVPGRSPVSGAPGLPGRDRPTIDFSGTVNVYANDPESFARQMEAYGANLEMRAGYSRFATVTG